MYVMYVMYLLCKYVILSSTSWSKCWYNFFILLYLNLFKYIESIKLLNTFKYIIIKNCIIKLL